MITIINELNAVWVWVIYKMILTWEIGVLREGNWWNNWYGKLYFLGQDRQLVKWIQLKQNESCNWIFGYFPSSDAKTHTHHRQEPLKVIRLKVYWGYCLDIRAGKYWKAGENCVMKSFVVCNWLTCVGQPMSRREPWRCCGTAACNDTCLSRPFDFT
jgi:hypothetical protein